MTTLATVAWQGNPGDLPQGLAVDEAGYVWAALRGASKVSKLGWEPLSGSLAQVEGERLTTPGPSELLFDGTYVWATHSYVDHEGGGPTVLSGTLSRVSTVTDQVVDVQLDMYMCDQEAVQIGAGPGRLCWDRAYVWASATVHMDVYVQRTTSSATIPMDVPILVQINPVSTEATTGVPPRFMGELLAVDYDPLPDTVTTVAGPVTRDVLDGLWLTFNKTLFTGEVEEESTCVLRIPKNCSFGEFDHLALRRIPPGSLLTISEPELPGCGLHNERTGLGVVVPFVGFTDGDILVWEEATSRWIPAPGGGGGFVAGKDLASISATEQEVVGIRTISVDVDARMPTDEFMVLLTRSSMLDTPPYKYVLSRLTEDMILPGFAITAFSSSVGPLVEVGDIIGALVPIPFTAAYSQPPPYGAVTLWDADNAVEEDVSATPTAFDSSYSFVRNTYGGSILFRLTAIKNGVLKTRNYSITWVRRVYWFAATSPGSFPSGFDQAWVEANHLGVLASNKNRTFIVSAGDTVDNKHIYYLYRDGYPDSQFWVNGFQGGFTKLGTINLTTPGGATEAYAVYQSNQVGLGDTQVTVTD